jgi:regulator of sigma E protease
MQDVHTVIVAIVAFIVLVGLMVVVHEFGHFVVAKLFGVRVEAFSFGFGPRLFGYKYGETDYKVCLLPLGGYVKMTGESPEQNLEAPGTQAEVLPDDPGSFLNHPRWQRMLIGLAGPTANLILAFVLMVFYFGWINEVPDIHPIVVEWVSEGSAAAQAGIETGDVIRRFGTADNPNWMQIETNARHSVNQTVPVTVERGGKLLSLALPFSSAVKGKKHELDQAGLFLQYLQSPIDVESVVSNSPAEKAGLRANDLILAVDGHAFHSLDPMADYLQSGHGKPVTLSVSRNSQVIAPLVVYPSIQDSTWRIGIQFALPKDIPTHREPMALAQAVPESENFCVESSTLILDVLRKLVTHKASISQLSGPVGIARVAGDAAESKGWDFKFGLAASISLNLGILNLLPFPILDGGGILFLLIEWVMRRDININVKERIYQAAFMLWIALFAFITFNDITKLPIFTHFKP